MWMDIAQQEGDHDPRNSDEEDTVFDRTNPFYEKPVNGASSSSKISPIGQRDGDSSTPEINISAPDEQDTRCGIFSWRPHLLQKLANKNIFLVVFTVVGVLNSSFWTYFTASISTMEKRFGMNSITSGTLLITNEFAQLLVAVLFTYFNFRKHRAKMMTLGVALSSLSCFLLASPHFLMGSGEMSLSIIKPTSDRDGAQPHTFITIPDGMGFELQDQDLHLSETLPLVQDSALNTSSNAPSDIETTSKIPTTSSSPETINTDIITIGTNENSTSSINTMPPNSSSSGSTAEGDNRETTTPRVFVSLMNDEMHSVWPTCRRDIEHISSNVTSCDDTPVFERKLAFAFIFTANFISGIGTMLYLLSGGPFSEDSTILPNEIPRIFAITMSIRLIGSFFGYLFAWSCLSEFINPLETPIQIDSRWLGAYWLGWLCLSFFMAFFAFVFALFPRQCPREFLRKRSLTHDTGLAMLLLPSVAPFFGGAELKTANAFPPFLNISGVFQAFYRNKVYLLLTFSTMTHIFVSIGYFTFLPKYLEFMFRLHASHAAMFTGISSLPFQVAGLMLGGAFIARYLPSPKEISHWSCVVTSLQIVSLLILSFLGCDTTKVDTSFLQHQKHYIGNVSSSGNSHCSADCDCSVGPPIPVCDLYTGNTYYSPCLAGCDDVVNQTGVFSQCSCLPNKNTTLVEGFCPGDGCANGLIAFLVFICLGQFLRGTGVVGRMLLSYKSLQADQRTSIIGLTLLILSLMSVIPSPLVFGSLFESACLVRDSRICEESANNDGNTLLGNCWLYNDASLRFIFNLSAAAFLVVAFTLDALLWKNQDVHDLRIYDGELRQLTTSNSGSRGNNRFSTVALT